MKRDKIIMKKDEKRQKKKYQQINVVKMKKDEKRQNYNEKR
jgi:hypothetical protein